jgi:hypothetical protein
MDEPKTEDNTQDMTVGDDGVLNDSTVADASSASPEENDSTTAPFVNEVTPPPSPDVTSSTEAETIQVKVAPKEEPAESTNDSKEEMSDSASENLAPVTAAPAVEDSIDTPVDNPSTPEAETSDETSAMPKPEQNSKPAEQAAPAMMGVAASQMNKHPHRNNKKLAAVVTVIVAVLLALIAVYVYVSANDNTSSDGNSVITPQTSDELAPESEPITSTDIDQATADVEQAVNDLDEASDFPEAELSDTSLGL